jgi:hypothetical protein
VGTPVPTPTPVAGRWIPAPGTTWQWQLSGALDLSVDAAVYDIDFSNSASVVAELRARGRKVICYMSVGAWESYRPDASAFPPVILGKVVPDYPTDRYLDIRSPLLRPLLEARLDECAGKGFDAIEPDIDDSYAEGADVTGFPLTYQDQITFNTWLAGASHARGLSIVLKNAPAMAVALADVFDMALDESCFLFDECSGFSAFINRGKAVFHVEYQLAPAQFCSRANAMHFSSIQKHKSLDAWRVTCW